MLVSSQHANSCSLCSYPFWKHVEKAWCASSIAKIWLDNWIIDLSLTKNELLNTWRQTTVFSVSCFKLQRGKKTLFYDNKLSLRNTDPPRVTIIHNILDPLFIDSDRQAKKLLLWQAEYQWQAWFISVYNHVTGATQALRRGDNSTGPSDTRTHTRANTDIRIRRKHLTEATSWTHAPFCSSSLPAKLPHGKLHMKTETSSSTRGQDPYNSFWMFVLLLFPYCHTFYLQLTDRSCFSDSFANIYRGKKYL